MTFDQEFFDKTSGPLIECSKQASEEIIKIYESDEFEASDKDDGSPLTAADRVSNEIILENLSKITPSIPIISEENFNIKLLKHLPSMYWLVDPLDGTKEFINKTDEFTVNIALIENGKTVYGVVGEPTQDKHWIGSNLQISENDNDVPNVIRVVMSKSHKSENDEYFLNFLEKKDIKYEIIEKGSSLKLCSLADNQADIYPRFGPTSEWDIAAAHAVLKSYGGNVLRIDNLLELSYAKTDSILNPYFICIRNKAIKDAFLPILGDFFKKLV